ncbi:unnamed protein product [Absidia cylindrospora]
MMFVNKRRYIRLRPRVSLSGTNSGDASSVIVPAPGVPAGPIVDLGGGDDSLEGVTEQAGGSDDDDWKQLNNAYLIMDDSPVVVCSNQHPEATITGNSNGSSDGGDSTQLQVDEKIEAQSKGRDSTH